MYKQRETEEVRAIRALGLEEGETRTYLALLSLGPATVAATARAAGLRRSIVFNAFARLQKQGLVSTFPRGKRLLHFAEPPARLQDVLNRSSEALAGILPMLESLYHRPGGMPVVRMIQGVEALREMHDRMVASMQKGQAYYRFSSPVFAGGVPKYLSRAYRTHRDAKQLQRFIITSMSNAKRKKPSLDREIRIVPDGEAAFAYNVTMLIFANTVELIDYNSDVAVILEDRLVADFCRHIFLLLFARLPVFTPKA